MLGKWLGSPVHPVHRLDRATSGALLFATNSRTAHTLALQFQEGVVGKRYLAIVRGYVWGATTLIRPIRRKLKGDERAPAETGIRSLDRTEVPYPVGRYQTARYSLVELNLVTGRPHQARKHMHHLAHPVVGDKRYGDKDHNTFFREHYGCEEMLLRSMYLSFRVEENEPLREIVAPIPEHWRDLAGRLGLEMPADYRPSPAEAFTEQSEQDLGVIESADSTKL